MSENSAQTMTLEESLNKTDFGHFLYEKRKTVFAALLVIVALILGYYFYKHQKNEAILEASQETYIFQTKTFKDFKDKKLSAEDFVKAFAALPQSTKSSGAMLPVVIEAAELINAENKLELSYSLLLEAEKHYAANSLTAYIANLHLAVICENLGKNDEAIAILEKIAKSGHKILQTKVALDLGRLYKNKGDKARAKTQFEYIIKDFPNDDMAKLAKLYLQELNA